MKYLKQPHRIAGLVALMAVLLIEVSCSVSQHIALAPGQYIDPVCGIVVNEQSAIFYSYQGTFYYFDTEECLAVFKKNPNKFLDQPPGIREGNTTHMGWWLPVTGGIMVVGMTLAMILGLNH